MGSRSYTICVINILIWNLIPFLNVANIFNVESWDVFKENFVPSVMFGHYLQVKRNKARMIYVLMHGNNMTKMEIQLIEINIKCLIAMKMSKLLKMEGLSG